MLSRKAILQRAWPIILANAAVPILGLADTAVIGNFGSTAALGAIALGAVIFSFVYWSFGFLRMGTTGFVAQAAGSGQEAELRAALARALLLAVALGGAIILLRGPVADVSFQLLDASEAVEAPSREYVAIRVWGAPATLATFALLGALIGLGRSRTLLTLQLFLNGSNILLDIYFAGILGMGAAGIALGTVIAEWASCALGSVVLYRLLKRRQKNREPFISLSRLVDPHKLKQTVAANGDIMVRTVTLVFAFAWFANRGAGFGDTLLAANHILLQLISFSAFFLDGYAFVLESLVGRALGAGQHRELRVAVRRSSELALITALCLAGGVWLLGGFTITFLTDLEAVRQAATDYLPWTALYIALSVWAFQLDGIFIGATRTREMRQAALMSLAIFLVAEWLLTERFGNRGLWWSFIIFVVARAAALAAYYPRIAGRSPEPAPH